MRTETPCPTVYQHACAASSASSSTVARWVKTYLGWSGVTKGLFSLHSARGATASEAVASGVSIDSILQTAQWSRESIH